MAEKPFRVLLDLTDLHIESFKYVWISVSPREIRNISEFKRSLYQKINLGAENIKLFVRDGLLLDEETIIVLREDDTVKVQYETQFYTMQDTSENFTKSKSCMKRNFSECDEEDMSVNRKRHKISDNVACTTQNESYPEDVNNKRKKKHKKSLRPSHDENVYSDVKEGSKNVSGKHKKKSKEQSSLMKVDSNSHENYVSFAPSETQLNTGEICKKNVPHGRNMKDKALASATFEAGTKDSLPSEVSFNKSEVESNMHDQLNISNSTTGFTNNCPKKKRKRHRKRKKPDLVNEVPSNVSAHSEYNSFSTEISSEFLKRKHIIYTSCSSEKAEDKPEVINLDSNDNCDTHTTNYIYIDGVPRSEQNNDCLLYPKVSTPAQSNGCADPNWQVSLMQNYNSDPAHVEGHSAMKQNVKSSKYNKAMSEQNLKKNLEENSNGKESCYDLPYAKLPPLNSIPDVGAHIVYKILELNENYSPEVSEYREGIVKSIDPESDEMEIELLKHEIKPGRTGKFENLKEDEMPPPEIKKTDIVCWSALIEPKLISR